LAGNGPVDRTLALYAEKVTAPGDSTRRCREPRESNNGSLRFTEKAGVRFALVMSAALLYGGEYLDFPGALDSGSRS
jgi:hypothetical protein